MVRWNFGRDHHPVSRKLAQVLVTIGMALSRAPKPVAGAAMVRTAGGISEASSRGTLGRDPPQHFAERVLRIRALATGSQNEHRQLSVTTTKPRACSRCSTGGQQIDPIVDKLAFYELCKTHGIPTPEVLAAFAPTGKLMDFRSGLPPQHDLFVKARTGQGGLGAERFRWDRLSLRKQPWLSA